MPSRAGGVEDARRLASHLNRTGFQVQVVTKRVSRQQPVEGEVDDVRVHRVGPVGDRRGSGKWLVLPRVFAKTLQLEASFDVIVCIDFRGIGIAAVAAGRLLHRAVILQAETGGTLISASHGSASGVPRERGIVRALKSAPRAIYRRADHIVCIGHDIEREALETGVPRDRVHYLPHGVDLVRFHPAVPGEARRLRTDLGWPTDRPIVLFVGRLSIEKGVLDLLEAWRLVARGDALLVLVGPDMPAHPWDAGRKARAYVARHALEDCVRFAGPAPETAHLYRAADLFVQPSHFEAFGLSAIEAMASGVPVLASNVEAARLSGRQRERAPVWAAYAAIDCGCAHARAFGRLAPCSAGRQGPRDGHGGVRRTGADGSIRPAHRTGAGDTPMIRNLAYASLSAASAGLLVVLFILAGRALGDVEFGKFSFALALGTIFETLMDFGLHQATIRAVARDKSRATEILHHTLGIKLVWATAAFAALVATATILRPQWDVRLACYLVGGSLVLRSYMLTIRGVLQGLERFGWDSVVVAVDRNSIAFGAVALAAGAKLRGLVYVRGGARHGRQLTAWLTQAQLGGMGLRFDRVLWAELQKKALPLGLFLVVLNLYSYIDAVMLGVMRTDVETGLYTAAYRVYEGLTYAPSVIAAVLTPRLSGLFVSDRVAHRRVALFGLTGSVALAFTIGTVAYVLSAPLILLLFGPAFAGAIVPFRMLCLGLAFVFVIWVLHAIAISVNAERLLVKTGLAGLAVNVGLNLYVIPSMGANGAAFATVVGELVSMGVLIAGVGSHLWKRP